jgi:hypothetical protein
VPRKAHDAVEAQAVRAFHVRRYAKRALRILYPGPVESHVDVNQNACGRTIVGGGLRDNVASGSRVYSDAHSLLFGQGCDALNSRVIDYRVSDQQIVADLAHYLGLSYLGDG